MSLEGAGATAGYSIEIDSPGSSIPLIVVLHVSPGDTGKGSVRVPVEMTSPARTDEKAGLARENLGQVRKREQRTPENIRPNALSPLRTIS